MIAPMNRSQAALLAVLIALAAVTRPAAAQEKEWPQHSMDRTPPRVVDPGKGALPVPPPADAVVLFGGGSLDQWESDSGKIAAWRVADDYFEVVPGTGMLRTKRPFGDVQLHVEWQAPAPPEGEGQDRGNSGVFFLGQYEVQVLDSYNNRTYADGQAASLYGQFPPLVNVSRPPGAWQSYDIVFHGPRFGSDGSLQRPATMTVFHNGVLVQDHMTLLGPTSNKVRLPYAAHPDRLPISLQDHGHKVRFRNIWVRELK
jgi:hypothetical protein